VHILCNCWVNIPNWILKKILNVYLKVGKDEIFFIFPIFTHLVFILSGNGKTSKKCEIKNKLFLKIWEFIHEWISTKQFDWFYSLNIFPIFPFCLITLHQHYLHWQKVAQNECWMLQEKFYNYISRFETGGLENSITSKQKELKVKVLQFFYRNTFSIVYRPGYIKM